MEDLLVDFESRNVIRCNRLTGGAEAKQRRDKKTLCGFCVVTWLSFLCARSAYQATKLQHKAHKGFFYSMNADHELAHYCCMRSTALWFARLDPAPYSVTTNTATYTFSQGENYTWATFWLEQLQDFWGRLLTVRAAVACPHGMKSERLLSAEIADSAHATSGCICPVCTAQEIEILKRGTQ